MLNKKQLIWALVWVIGLAAALAVIYLYPANVSGFLRVFTDLILLPLFFVELALIGLLGYEKLEK